jgi:carbon monoxide dehydrogenase subunit G
VGLRGRSTPLRLIGELGVAETRYSTTARLPVETIWSFVEDMDNWASYLVGYQSHEKLSDDRSVWVLKGDVGALQRIVKFNVNVTEWAGPRSVRFELEGVNEPMSGHGAFSMEETTAPASATDPAPASATDPTPMTAAEPVPRRESWGARILERLLRFFHRLVHGQVERAAGADQGVGPGVARLTLELQIQPGGTMAPMIDALIQPAMKIAAEELATRIIAHLERDRDAAESPELQPPLE